jgi:hypothetical protein
VILVRRERRDRAEAATAEATPETAAAAV